MVEANNSEQVEEQKQGAEDQQVDNALLDNIMRKGANSVSENDHKPERQTAEPPSYAAS